MDSRIYQPADSSSVNEGASPESQPSHRRGIWAGAGVGALAALSALLIPNLRVGVSQVGADSPEPVPLAASAERPAVASEPKSALEPHPAIPEQHLPPFKLVTSTELRAELQKGFEQMFWLGHQANGSEYISILSDSLLNGGMNRAETVRTLVAVVNDGFLNFQQRREAVSKLGELFPSELGDWARQRALNDNPLASGRIRLEILGSDLLEEPGASPQLEISCSQFTPGTNDVQNSDRLVVQAKAIFSAPSLPSTEVQIAKDVAFAADERGYLFQQHETFTPAIPEAFKRPAENGTAREFWVHLLYETQPFRGTEALGAKPVQGESWLLFTPLKDSPGGYTATVVGADSQPLAHAEIPTTVARWMYIRAVLQQGSIRAAALGQKLATESQNALVGQSLSAIELVPMSRDGRHTLELPQRGDVILEFGATWCGPCKVIAPSVEKFADAVAPLGVKVFRLSIDTDKERFAAALKAYPGGIIAKGAAATLSLDRVPMFIHVHDGKIVTAETTSATRLDELQRVLTKK